MSLVDKYNINDGLIDILNDQKDLLISTEESIYKDLLIFGIVLNDD